MEMILNLLWGRVRPLNAIEWPKVIQCSYQIYSEHYILNYKGWHKRVFYKKFGCNILKLC